MKKILFYIENNWAFGRIHNDLIKALYPEVHCDIIDWRIPYTLDDINSFLKKYDYFISTTHGAFILNTQYQVPLNRIGAIVHANSDITHIYVDQKLEKNYFNLFKSYGAISPIARTMSIAHDIFRIPQIVEVGCFRNFYKKNNSKQLKTIGYVGALFNNYNTQRVDIKRGYLVKKVSEITGTPMIHFQGLHFLGCEEFYPHIDILIFSSLTESLPMPPIEAFCSGVPVIGTNVGIFPELAKSGGGVLVPFEEDLFINETVNIINNLKSNPEKYQEMSEKAYQESENYDWSRKKQSWLKFIDSLYM